MECDFMHTIKNNMLTAQFLTKGAELISLKDQISGKEYLMRDSRYWGYTAPHLFPVVGMLSGGRLLHEGEYYPQKRHGFSRNMDFQVVSHTENQIVFELSSSEETLALFPFDFKFRVLYTLNGNKLTITYEVENTNPGVLPYSIGAHPAFWVPSQEGLSFEDYELVFEQVETAHRIPIALESGLLRKPAQPFLNGQQRLPLTKALFLEDALIFENLASSYISIVSKKAPGEIRFHFKEFPFLGIWTTEDQAPFLCLEPWAGHADYEGFQGEFLEKEDNVLLAAGEKKALSYSIEILS